MFVAHKEARGITNPSYLRKEKKTHLGDENYSIFAEKTIDNLPISITLRVGQGVHVLMFLFHVLDTVKICT